MSIRALRRVLPVPDHPVAAGPVERWESAERALGTKLPRDYRAFALTYGSGQVRGLWIYNPCAKGYLPSVRQWMEDRRKSGRGGEYGIFPAEGGLLPIARTDSRLTINYQTKGKPNKWPLIVEMDGLCWVDYDLTLTEFLTQILKGVELPPWEDDGFVPGTATFGMSAW